MNLGFSHTRPPNRHGPVSEDYYKILGVGRGATDAEIQKAYRDLARKHHPDLNPDDKSAKERFQKVQAAFDVLNNKEKRQRYDQFGSNFESMGQHGPQGQTHGWAGQAGGGASFDFSGVDLGDLFGAQGEAASGGGLGDIFRQFRRGSPRQPAPPAGGADIAHELTVPFSTAVTGGEAQITVQRDSDKVETIHVKIPAGIDDGKKIRLRGQGEAGSRGTPAGDILLTVRVSPHPHFRRRGKQLEVTLPVTVAEAALGAKVEVPSPTGVITLQIPPGTSSGAKLRIRGHGVPQPKATPGDLYAVIQIVLPEDLDDEDRQALEAIAKKHPQDPRSNLRW